MGEKGRHITPQEMVKAAWTDEEDKIVSALEQRAVQESKKPRKTTTEQISVEQGKKIQQIENKMDSLFGQYHISRTIVEAEKKGISLSDTIDEAYAEIFDQQDNSESNEKREILKKQLLDKITKRFETFLPALSTEEEKEINFSIQELTEPFQSRLKKKLLELEDAHTKDIEERFKKYIEPFVAAKIIKEQRTEMAPGLLRVDVPPEPPETIENNNPRNQRPGQTRVGNRISGFFKNLFS